MKVYTLTENCYVEDVLIIADQLLGVFGSLEKAQNAMKELMDHSSLIDALYVEDAVKDISEYEGTVAGTYNEQRISFRFTITEYNI